MSRIDELENASNTALLARRRIEVRLRELLECVDRLAAAARVAIAWKIHQIQAVGIRGWGLDQIVVHETRLARRGARAGDLLFHECVDEAGFADVRAAHHGNLGYAGVRELRGRSCRKNKVSVDALHLTAISLRHPGVDRYPRVVHSADARSKRHAAAGYALSRSACARRWRLGEPVQPGAVDS